MLVAVCSAVVTLPALIEVNLGTAADPLIVPVAFYAVTSVAVQGLYLSFAIPIYLRWKHGENFEVGAWNNGPKYKWMNPIAVAEIVIVSVYLMMPFVPGAVPFSDDFEWKFVNYAPIVTIGVLAADHDLVGVVGQELVQGPGPHDRSSRGPADPMTRGRPAVHPVRLGEVVLRRVGGHAFEGCVEQLATAIRLGVYPLGSMLPSERELAHRMGVSRATLARGHRRPAPGRHGPHPAGARRRHGRGLRAGCAGVRRGRARCAVATSCSDSLVFRRVVEPGAWWVAAHRAKLGCPRTSGCCSAPHWRRSTVHRTLPRTGRRTPGCTSRSPA